MAATLKGIAKGQIFTPFHHGYFDASDDIARQTTDWLKASDRSIVSIVEY